MPEPSSPIQDRYVPRIIAAQKARAKLAVAGETFVTVLRVQSAIAFCATLAVILWLIFHGYGVWTCFFIGLGCIFQVVLLLFLAWFIETLTTTQVETLRSSLTTMCLTLGLPDPEPDDAEPDEVDPVTGEIV